MSYDEEVYDGEYKDEEGRFSGGEDDARSELDEEAGQNGTQDEAEESDDAADESGTYNAEFVNEEVFEQLVLGADMIAEVQAVWQSFLQAAESREAAGEAIYSAIFEAAPSLQSNFKTPRAILALRFVNSLNTMVNSLNTPQALKTLVETLGFQHMDMQVTTPRVGVFRDAILDCLQVELAARLTPLFIAGFKTLLNYAGGAFIYVRVQYAERLQLLASSWAHANKKQVHEDAIDEDIGDQLALPADLSVELTKAGEKMGKGDKKVKGKQAAGKDADALNGEKGHKDKNTAIPTNFNEMFVFNAAVMGFSGRAWMTDVLSAFDAIVTNTNNSYRLNEECSVLALRLAKQKGPVQLHEYKTVMLASLRSLVKDWGSPHEVCWAWLWENVERKVLAEMGKPAKLELALSRFMSAVDNTTMEVFRREIYIQFFSLAPGGQDYFKQSVTRLHYIVDRVLFMTLEMYRQPKKMVEDLSGLGLRHVGYGIPVDYFGPWVTAFVQVIRSVTDDEQVHEAFRWSLSLVSRILTRVITEGSTLVMQAINENSAKHLKKAMACASRGERALWALSVQVGTQSISPLLWAIETGSLDTARAMLEDLLTIRGDRDNYYYGMDLMFERHPDLIKRLCMDAPSLVVVLLDGLVWRSRFAVGGMRRVNYYVKHLIVDADGGFSSGLEWLVDHRNATLMCHPAVTTVTDTLWSQVAQRTFLFGRMWFLFTLLIFVLAQSILNHLPFADDSTVIRCLEFVFRAFIYICSMGNWMYHHTKKTMQCIRANDFTYVGRCRVPAYLANWQEGAGFALTCMLLFMLFLEPILHCLGQIDVDGHAQLFHQDCQAGQDLSEPYSILSTAAMLLYFLLLVDMSVFSTRISAYVLVCGQMYKEVFLYLVALTFLIVAWAFAVNCLDQDDPEFHGFPSSVLGLYKIAFSMQEGNDFTKLLKHPTLLVMIMGYVILAVVFLLSLLIAQLSCRYQATYADMIGYARLNRGRVVCDTMPSVPKARWNRFVESLGLGDKLPFSEGDLGVSGGFQVLEPARLHFTTEDTVRRFAGPTASTARWPAEDRQEGDDVDHLDRVERLILKMAKRVAVGKKGGGAGSSRASGSVSGMSGLESAYEEKSASENGTD